MKRTVFGTGILVLALLFNYSALAEQANERYAKTLVCSKAFEALGKIGASQAAPLLLKGLQDADFFIRANSALALGAIGHKPARQALRKLRDDKNYLVRIFAVQSLLILGEADMEKELLNFLNHADAQVRANTAGPLGYFRDRYAAELLGLLEDKDDAVRIKAIEQLGNLKYQPASPLILRFIEDQNTLVRQAACAALGRLGAKEAVPALQKSLDDSDSWVRSCAFEALALLQDESIIPACRKAILGDDLVLKGSAYFALAILKQADILPQLCQEIIAPQTDSLVRMKSAQALTSLQAHLPRLIGDSLTACGSSLDLSWDNLQLDYQVAGKGLLLYFTEALKDTANPLYKDAPFVLREFRQGASFAFLREALEQDDPETVANIAFVLGELHDAGAVEYLISAVKKYGF